MPDSSWHITQFYNTYPIVTTTDTMSMHHITHTPVSITHTPVSITHIQKIPSKHTVIMYHNIHNNNAPQHIPCLYAPQHIPYSCTTTHTIYVLMHYNTYHICTHAPQHIPYMYSCTTTHTILMHHNTYHTHAPQHIPYSCTTYYMSHTCLIHTWYTCHGNDTVSTSFHDVIWQRQ